MLSAYDMGLVTDFMTGINAPPSLIEQIVDILNDNSTGLDGQVVTDVGGDWFGGSTSGHRLGVNTKMAHQEVEEEFQKLADSLRKYGEAITQWATEVRDIDGDTNAEMTMRAAALAEVNTTIGDARDQAADSTMGDGTYTEPPATQDGGA
ncbi:hypothetical protein GCM10011376_17270 [Nocardioides flavus (ex Wang et al. 2016)]|uniref:WXG100 family type VII secretion target n=1 Tax=Nocardioides flavus (ex Wang et al. 2016) TaxID=2058780 RepID=A0ABQ3HKZ6_9ACTN|nr:hypothetical protein [Nocardioides flavus (ex Wang et al. 2016)]GHE17117.1 hypothetical protein GCM10011376_17270 [Nocardioides flavus (ex Wang et al. 2016)]